MVAGRFVRLLAFVVGTTAFIQPQVQPPCAGCISSETPADSTIGEVFDNYGKTIQAQTQAMAQEQGENGVFAEFVPVKYAWQRVAGINFYVKVRVGEGQFADVTIYSSWDDLVAPVIHSITLHVTEDAPISGTDDGPHAVDLPRNSARGCPGCRSDEADVDEEVAGLFGEHCWLGPLGEHCAVGAEEFLQQAVSMAQAQGQNAEFTEFTPVRYSWQRVAGKIFYVKVRVAEGAFADLRIFQSFVTASNAHLDPYVTGLVLGVSVDAPITDSFANPPAVAV